MTDTVTYIPEAPPAPQEPYAGSFPKRVVDTFISPIALFQRFGSRPPWVDVMILSTIITVIAITLIPADVWVATMEDAMRRQGANASGGMAPETMANAQRFIMPVMGAAWLWVLLPILAGLMVLIFSVIMGGRATFRQYVSVVAHAGLIGAVGSLAVLPITLQKGVVTQGITLGALAGGMDPESFVYQFLNAWNVFLVWQVVVMALGAAALNRRIGAGTAVAVVLGVYACIAAGIAAAF
jgi:hypothetical protein